MFGFDSVFPREGAASTAVYRYYQAKASDSFSEYSGVEDEFTPTVARMPRLRRWASDSLFRINRAALLLWLLVVPAAACVTLLPLMHRSTLGLPVVADDPTHNMPSCKSNYHFEIRLDGSLTGVLLVTLVMQEFQLTEEYTTSNVTDAEVDRVLEAWKKLMPSECQRLTLLRSSIPSFFPFASYLRYTVSHKSEFAVGRGFVKPTRNLDQLTVGIGSSDFPETDGLRGVAVFHEIHCLVSTPLLDFLPWFFLVSAPCLPAMANQVNARLL